MPITTHCYCCQSRFITPVEHKAFHDRVYCLSCLDVQGIKPTEIQTHKDLEPITKRIKVPDPILKDEPGTYHLDEEDLEKI